MHDTQCIMGLSSWNLQVFLPWSQFYSSSCQHYIWTAGGGTVPNLSCVTEMTTGYVLWLILYETELLEHHEVWTFDSLELFHVHTALTSIFETLTTFDLSILKMGKMGENTKKICRYNIYRNLLFLKRKRKKKKKTCIELEYFQKKYLSLFVFFYFIYFLKKYVAFRSSK